MKNYRLALYAYWNPNHSFQLYAIYYIKALTEICDKIIVIINGKIKKEEAEFLKDQGLTVLQRSNIGFDFAAWREGLKHIGLEKIKYFNEIIFCNSSCYGPIGGSFTPMLKEMASSDADIWSISSSTANKKLPWHMQSNFLVFRKRIIRSTQFQRFWENLPTFQTYEEAVKNGEKNLTLTFQSQGFKCESLIKNPKFYNSFDPTLEHPIELLKEGSVLIRRKVFSMPHCFYLEKNLTKVATLTYKYIQEHSYPTRLIDLDLTRSLAPSQLKDILQLTFILYEKTLEGSDKNSSILFFFIYNEKNFNEIKNFLTKSMHFIKLSIVSPSLHLLKKLKAFTICNSDIVFHHEEGLIKGYEIYFFLRKRIQENLKNFHAIGIMNDWMLEDVMNPSIKFTCRTEMYNNMAESAKFVKNIVSIFQNNPSVGILYPPLPICFFPYLLSTYKKLLKPKLFHSHSTYGKVKDIQDLNLEIVLKNNILWFHPKILVSTPPHYNSTMFSLDKISNLEFNPLITSNISFSKLSIRNGYFLGWILPSSHAISFINAHSYFFIQIQTLIYKRFYNFFHISSFNFQRKILNILLSLRSLFKAY